MALDKLQHYLRELSVAVTFLLSILSSDSSHWLLNALNVASVNERLIFILLHFNYFIFKIATCI